MRVIALFALAACAPPMYVANVYENNGQLYQQKCPLRSNVLASCTDEPIGEVADTHYAADEAIVEAPAKLDHDLVSLALDDVDTSACAGAHVVVAPDGSVTDAGDARCAQALRGVHFPRTQRGGGFTLTASADTPSR